MKRYWQHVYRPTGTWPAGYLNGVSVERVRGFDAIDVSLRSAVANNWRGVRIPLDVAHDMHAALGEMLENDS